MNAGIREASGDYVCVIGNDVFPEARWLDTILRIARQTKAYITSPINDKTELKNYKLREIEKDVYEARFFPAVCWLIKRKCLDEVGLFDEEYAIGTYEDNDYIERMRIAEGKLVVTTKVCVKHLENQTLNLMGDIRDIMNENSKIFHARYKH
jgi:GT2 family glycosyltransferase